ncbi:SdpI family protein [Sinorhizobium psoraleae]|nr:SdpI family protein [Sinorhizobium psoraleae]
MVMVALVLCAVAPLIAAVVLPSALAQDARVAEAVLLTVLALFIMGLMGLWLNSSTGATVFRALGWRCRLLQFSIVALLSTVAGLLLFVGPVLKSWHYGILTAEIGVLLLAGGLASMVAPRNRIIGFRTPRTLASDETWRVENRIWGRRLAMSSLVAFLAAFAGSWGPLLLVGVALTIGISFLIDDWRRGRR